MPGKRAPIEERFWNKVVVAEEHECWLWTGANKGGYGKIGIGGKVDSGAGYIYTHRLSWKLSNGPIPEGMWVLHHCDNPPCCNPKHLFLGHQTDNIQDAVKKGRHFSPNRGVIQCKWGHPFSDENTYLVAGRRQCRECKRQRAQKFTRGAR